MSTQESTNADELLRAAVSGDIDAYTELFEGYREELCREVSFIIEPSKKMEMEMEMDVEDVIQEIFRPVFLAIQGKDPNELNLRAYLHAAARNEAFAVLKRKKREEPKDVHDSDFEEALSRAGLGQAFELVDEMLRDSRSDEIREAFKDGDQERINRLGDELRRSMREIKEPDSEDKEDS